MDLSPGSRINYSSIYLRDYPGHGHGATSFPATAIPCLAALARDLGCSHAADLGAGNGHLGLHLAAEDIKTISVDFRPFPEAGVLPFDLTSRDRGELNALLGALARFKDGEPHLALCLDVLEHFDRADLPAVLANLNALTERYLLCSISTRPSSDFNLYHATVLPTSSWLDILKLSGFRVVAHPILESLKFHNSYPNLRNLWTVLQWRLLDPYRESRNPEPNYLLLERISSPFINAEAEILEITRCRIAPIPVEIPDDLHFTFLLAHTQNFSLYEPFWDVMPKSQLQVLVREGLEESIEPNRLDSLLAWIKCRGISHHLVQSVDDFPWSHRPRSDRIFFSASESTAADCHLHNLAFVANARFHGYLTALLQHGIWIEDFADPITFLSDLILAWSPEHYDCFQSVSAAAPSSRQWTRGLVEKERFQVVGCPKFDAYAQPGPSAVNLLGAWTQQFERMVLVTTNLLWGRHQLSKRAVWEDVATLASRFPQIVFVLKMHPSEDPDEHMIELLPPNLVVLSEPMCWAANIRTSDLIRAADLVATTLSTTALEAGLAGKPVYLFDTGVGLQYQHLAARDLKGLAAVLPELAVSGETVRTFTNQYYARETLGRALANALSAVADSLDRINPAGRMPTAADVVAKCLGRLASRRSAELLQSRRRA